MQNLCNHTLIAHACRLKANAFFVLDGCGRMDYPGHTVCGERLRVTDTCRTAVQGMHVLELQLRTTCTLRSLVYAALPAVRNMRGRNRQRLALDSTTH